MKKKLPIGVENFEKIRKEDFYYVDKTGLIRELLLNWGEVNLFTRPRRFGKSLNMSMLKSFFGLGGDMDIFQGLEISKETALCEKYMGKFPVISVSLKGIEADSYEAACGMAGEVVNEEARRLQFLLDSERLTLYDKEVFSACLGKMDEAALCSSLRNLTMLVHKHYGRKAILLIDEYDVPLAKAFQYGYYGQMLLLVRRIFAQALKANDSLYFAVLTGCMRVSKESVFTGLNNLNVLSIADVRFDEYFGFTDGEVRELLGYYGLSECYGAVKEWYDGYQFGDVELYCPWDVVCYAYKLLADKTAPPEDFWSNTSSNDIVRHFIEKAGSGAARREIEELVAGGQVIKEIRQELTYQDMYSSMDNMWSILYTTGYLTQRGKRKGKSFSLSIPNLEIREIFTGQIMEFFRENAQKDGEALDAFCQALENGDAGGVERQFNGYLRKTISIRDTFVKKQMKENFYHGILLGLLGFKEAWGVYSNKESGDGYGDILVETDDGGVGIVIEVKYAEDGDLEAGCRAALGQIEGRRYEEQLREEGIETILKYGIACHKKRCKVRAAWTQAKA